MFRKKGEIKLDLNEVEMKEFLFELINSGRYSGGFHKNTFEISRVNHNRINTLLFYPTIKGNVNGTSEKYIIEYDIKPHFITLFSIFGTIIGGIIFIMLNTFVLDGLPILFPIFIISIMCVFYTYWAIDTVKSAVTDLKNNQPNPS